MTFDESGRRAQERFDLGGKSMLIVSNVLIFFRLHTKECIRFYGNPSGLLSNVYINQTFCFVYLKQFWKLILLGSNYMRLNFHLTLPRYSLTISDCYEIMWNDCKEENNFHNFDWVSVNNSHVNFLIIFLFDCFHSHDFIIKVFHVKFTL